MKSRRRSAIRLTENGLIFVLRPAGPIAGTGRA
jgi:hypothetical protein